MIVFDRPQAPEWMRYHAVMTPSERIYILAALQSMVDELSAIKKKTRQDSDHIRIYKALIKRYNRPQLSVRGPTKR